METLSEAQDDSSGANPSSVKSEDGSPPPDGDRGSPPPNCAICLGRCRNKSFTDSCLHQFCFKCLVTWSRVKTECPLCKQNFKSIIHNVQSNQQYEEYRVEQRRQEEDRIDIDDLVTATRRFRYRTTLTFPRGNEHIALQRLLMHYPPLSAMVGMPRDLTGITPTALPASRRRRSPSSFRRTVYRHNLWARPLPDFTGRHRDCTPEFYRYNDSQMHRLVPWLNRELHYLLLENAGHIAYVLQRILELLPQYHITSPEFRGEMYRYFGSRTDHFLHELHCFASTPYDLTGYDRNVQYTTDSRISNTVNDVISSSDTESGDSDIVEVLMTPPLHPLSTPPVSYRPVTPILPSPYDPIAGLSARRLPDPVYPQNQITSPIEAARLARTVIPIETISHSDTDDDEVMVTGYIKPPHQRTPEVVDLRDSDDSDVVVTETPPAPVYGHGPVKLTLSRPHVLSPSDSDDGPYTPPHPPCGRPGRSSSSEFQQYSQSSSQTSSRTTPQWSSESLSPRTPSPPCAVSDLNEDLSDEEYFPQKRDMERAPKNQKNYTHVARTKRRRNRHSREAEREREAASAAGASTTAERSSPERDRREKDKRKKSKSSNGKGVKSSRRNDTTVSGIPETTMEVDKPRAESYRACGKGSKLSRRENSTESRRAESTIEVQEEPRPGLSQSGGKRVKSSRRDDNTESRREESTSQEESRPGPSSRPGGKGGKSSRKDTISTTESRRSRSRVELAERLLRLYRLKAARAGQSHLGEGEGKSSGRDDATEPSRIAEHIKVTEEPQPGPSFQSGPIGVQSFRRDNATISRTPEYTMGVKEESRNGTKSSRRFDSTESRRAESEITVEEEPQPGPSCRLVGKSSRKEDSTGELRRTESTTVQEESRSRPGGKGVKSSRRDDTTVSRLPESTMEVEEEPRMGVNSFQKDDTTESTRAESTTEVQEEPRSGLSQPGGKRVKSSRRDDTTESRRAESTTVQVESRPGPSSRPSGKSSRRDEFTTESRRAECTTIQKEPLSETSRPGGNGAKSSRRDDAPDSSRRSESVTEARPGPSSRAGLSGVFNSLKRKNTEEVHPCRNSRESKRLKSVVKKASSSSSVPAASLAAGPSSSAVRTLSSVVRASNSAIRASNSAIRASSSDVYSPNTTSSDSSKARSDRGSSFSPADDGAKAPLSPDFTDSDDDIPLNMTIQRSAGLS